MDLEKELSELSEKLILPNLDYSLLKLFGILEENLSSEEFSEITHSDTGQEEGFNLLIKKYPQVANLIKQAHKTIFSYEAEDNPIEIKENKDIENAIILAGGIATRLRPITYLLPKPLLPINGKTLTEHVIDVVKRQGIKNIVLSIGHERELIKEYFKDGSRVGANITYAEEVKRLGTAGPLFLVDKPKKPFVMINGDNLFDLNIGEMFSFFKENNAIGVIALTPVNNPSRGGAVKMNGDNIVRFCEKLSHEQAEKEIGKPPYWLNSGYYILSPEVFDFLPKQTQFTMMEKDIFPKLAETGRLFGFKSTAQWHDSGTPERYEEVVKKWKFNFPKSS